jgi:hypothetical protein
MANEKSGKAWIPADQKQLKALARGNTPTGIIAMKLGRQKGQSDRRLTTWASR